MTPETPHGAAHALADMGCSVLPIHWPDPAHPSACSCHRKECSSPGKHPLTHNGLNGANRDHELIERWYLDWPLAGVAIATGEPSDHIIVVDVDGPEGVTSLAKLSELPETVEATTGRGHHKYLRKPADVDVRNSAGKLGRGLDIRGTGGYIIAPPTVHPTGALYEWVRDPFNHDIAPAPDWLLDALVRKEPEPFPEPRELPEVYGTRYVQAAIEAECDELARTGEGGRNHRLNTAAYSLARFVADGKADGATVARALAFAAARAGLGRHEIEKTLRSAFTARGAA